MAIPEEEVAQVRAAADLVALAGEHVALKRQGRRWVGLCPFHSEKTPSFSINAEEGLYYCFGCQASGDAITFLRAMEHLDFVGAIELLAERAGITLHRDDRRADEERGRRQSLYGALDAAVSWYHERLLSHPDAGPAREYLRSRGYDGDIVRSFRLGWAPDEWDALSRALGLPDAVMKDAGLAFVNRAGRQQDTFRTRILFPIFDVSGRAVAFGGRVLPSAATAVPKYKNSPETAVYRKRRTLYGLNWAKTSVVETGEVVVCEGYTDVIALFRAGVPRAAATCGTALGEEHFQLIKKFARRVVLAYDADTAGREAAARFYEWEKRHELDIAIANFPAGSDPDEVARKDPSLLASAIESAQPFLEFRVDRVMEQANLATAEGRARTAEAAAAAVAEHPNELVRDQYLMKIGDRCRIDPDQLRRGLRRWRSDKSRRFASQATSSIGLRDSDTGQDQDRPNKVLVAPGPGTEALRLAIHRPEEVADYLEEELFTDPVQRDAFRLLAMSSTLHEAISRADSDSGELLRRLAVEDTEADALDVVARLTEVATGRALTELEAEARLSESRFVELAPVTTWLRQQLDRLFPRPPDQEALSALVTWLVKHG